MTSLLHLFPSIFFKYLQNAYQVFVHRAGCLSVVKVREDPLAVFKGELGNDIRIRIFLPVPNPKHLDPIVISIRGDLSHEVAFRNILGIEKGIEIQPHDLPRRFLEAAKSSFRPFTNSGENEDRFSRSVTSSADSRLLRFIKAFSLATYQL